jgi:hypothetical protein
MAALSNMRRTTPAADEEVPAWVGTETSDPVSAPDRNDVAVEEPGRARSWGVLLVIGGALLAIVVLFVAIVVMPSFNSSLAQVPTNATATQAFEAVPTLSRPLATSTVAVAAARATTVPLTLAAPTATPPTRPATPTSNTRPAAENATLQLMDVRFASGPRIDWLENPPFASWSDGAYRLQARQAARFVAIGAPVESWLSDVVVSATFRKTGGPPGGGYGLVIRDQGPDPRNGANQNMDAYVLETGDLGEFGIWRRDGDHWVDLVPWTRSSAVRPGGSPNDLMVRASGDRFTFSVNGVEVATVQDKTLDAGTVGVFVGSEQLVVWRALPASPRGNGLPTSASRWAIWCCRFARIRGACRCSARGVMSSGTRPPTRRSPFRPPLAGRTAHVGWARSARSATASCRWRLKPTTRRAERSPSKYGSSVRARFALRWCQTRRRALHPSRELSPALPTSGSSG